jgi:3-phenylpropionate/trans-cinnamate dioxygenase ferredoxin subunit
MKYIKVSRTDEVKEGEKKRITLGDKALLLTKVSGEYYAIDDRCPHMGGSLYEGVLNGNVIKCPKHGTMFDVRSGKVVQNGKIAFVRLRVRDTRAYPVKTEGSDILVGID